MEVISQRGVGELVEHPLTCGSPEATTPRLVEDETFDRRADAIDIAGIIDDEAGESIGHRFG
jgi:hypothetical protein